MYIATGDVSRRVESASLPSAVTVLCLVLDRQMSRAARTRSASGLASRGFGSRGFAQWLLRVADSAGAAPPRRLPPARPRRTSSYQIPSRVCDIRWSRSCRARCFGAIATSPISAAAANANIHGAGESASRAAVGFVLAAVGHHWTVSSKALLPDGEDGPRRRIRPRSANAQLARPARLPVRWRGSHDDSASSHVRATSPSSTVDRRRSQTRPAALRSSAIHCTSRCGLCAKAIRF